MRATWIVCCSAIAACVALLAGCDDAVIVYEPGVYKGETDPLLEMQSDPEQAERLRERLRAGQTDR